MSESNEAGAAAVRPAAGATPAMKKEVVLDGMQISTSQMDRDLMQVAGALHVGQPDVVHIVGRLREGDPDVTEILAQLLKEDLDVRQTRAARRLGTASQSTLSALINLQQDKPALLRSLAGLTRRTNWQEMLKSA